MTQIHILHALSAKAEAEAFTLGLQKEGYIVYWDPNLGGMTLPDSDEASRAACVIALWTRASRCSKWVLKDAANAEDRGRLVEVMLEPVESPFGPDVAPLDFSAWNGKPEGPLWKALVDRVRSTCGRPTGKLPLKEQAQPALLMVGITVATVSGLVSGVLPQADVKQMAIASGAYEQGMDETAMGGPIQSPRSLTIEAVDAAFVPVDVVTLSFEPMAPLAAPKMAKLEPVGVFTTTDMAAAEETEMELIPISANLGPSL